MPKKKPPENVLALISRATVRLAIAGKLKPPAPQTKPTLSSRFTRRKGKG